MLRHILITTVFLCLMPVRAMADAVDDAALDAHPGLAQMPRARTMRSGVLRVSLAGTWFRESDFAQPGGALTGVQSWAAIGFTPSSTLSVAASYAVASHRGAIDPSQIDAIGDLDFSALWLVYQPDSSLPVLRGVALRPGLRMLGGAYAATASPSVDVVASGQAGPVELSAGTGFLLDRSSGVVGESVVLDPSQRVAYGVADGSSLHWALGADWPLAGGQVTPWLQYRGRAYFGDASGDGPQLVGTGVRLGLPVAGRTAGLNLGVDIALAGTSLEPARPREPKVRALAQLVFVAPPTRTVEIKVPVEMTTQPPTNNTTAPATPAFGVMRGTVRDAESGEPLASTVVQFLGLTRNALITDDFGRWRAGELEPGSLRIRVQRSGYAPAVAEVEITKGETTSVEVELVSARSQSKTGTFSGVVKSRNGQPLQATLTVTANGRSHEVSTDERGRFREDLPPGSYTVRVEAKGHRAQTRSLAVTTGELTVFNVLLTQR